MSTLIINPGSHVAGGTEAQALANAREWLTHMRENGITDPSIVLDEQSRKHENGRWSFMFRHLLTGIERELSIHGLTEDEAKAFAARNIVGARPRVYWKGSSCSDPDMLDWMAPGYVLAIIPAGDE